MYTVVRKDIIEREESVPLKTLSGKDILTCDLSDDDTLFQSIQPEAWEDREFNILLISDLTGEIYYGLSIDWEDISYDEAKPEVKAEVKRFKKIIRDTNVYEVPFTAKDLEEAMGYCASISMVEPVGDDYSSVTLEISEEEFIKLGGKV